MSSERSDGSSTATTITRKYSEGPPWIFRGRALYQLHAVKSSVARNFVPPELKLVEAFGYTLGGLFLAHYDGSPAGEFDEAVIIAGIVWNPPTSCAWAAGVLVNSDEARVHGRKEVGLPSHLAKFSHETRSLPIRRKQAWWDARRWFSRARSAGAADAMQQVFKEELSLEIAAGDRGKSSPPLCRLVGIPRLLSDASLPTASPRGSQKGSAGGFPLKLFLPNFSGKTEDEPNLLKYSCALNCRVRVVPAARVLGAPAIGSSSGGEDDNEAADSGVVSWDGKVKNWTSILTGKPLVSVLFDRMVMQAGAPSMVGVKGPGKTPREAHTIATQSVDDLVLSGAAPPRGAAPS